MHDGTGKHILIWQATSDWDWYTGTLTAIRAVIRST